MDLLAHERLDMGEGAVDEADPEEGCRQWGEGQEREV